MKIMEHVGNGGEAGRRADEVVVEGLDHADRGRRQQGDEDKGQECSGKGEGHREMMWNWKKDGEQGRD